MENEKLEPKITIMMPKVVNVDGPSENVASKEIPDMECGVYEEYDYMKEVGDMLDSICKEPEAKTDEQVITQVMGIKSRISEITGHAIQTGLFVDAKNKYYEFLATILEIPERTEQIKQALAHFLTKICDAPTRIHMRGVVILCLPALDHVIKLAERDKAADDDPILPDLESEDK
jgi:hypothetical protein